MCMSDNELLKFTKDFTEEILKINGGDTTAMCFAVCSPLVSLLQMSGIECYLEKVDIRTDNGVVEHFYIALADNRVLDPTISQFTDEETGKKYPNYYLGDIPKLYLQ